MKVQRLHLDLTDACNLACAYCYVQSDRGNRDYRSHMTVEEWLSVIRQAVASGIRSFIVSGGEPLAFPGFVEILHQLEEHEARVTILTNLWRVPNAVVAVVENSSVVKEVVVSLDGFEGHDLGRPPSSWQDVAQAIKRLKGAGLARRVTVNTVLHKWNIDEMERLQRFVAEMRVDRWRVDIPLKPHRLDVMVDFRTAIEVAARLITNRYREESLQATELVLFRVYKSQLEGTSLPAALALGNQDLHPCDYFLGTLAIKPDGALALCSPLQLVFGNVRQAGLTRAIELAAQHKFFSFKVTDITDCEGCKYLRLCGSGCRADALRWTGSVRSADPISCVTMPLVEQTILPVLSPGLRGVYEQMIVPSGKPPFYVKLFPLERR